MAQIWWIYCVGELLFLIIYYKFPFCLVVLCDVSLSPFLSYRPAGGESNYTGVFPRRGDVCRNSSSSLPLSNGRQRDGVYYSHNKTPKRWKLDQNPHGPAWSPDPLSPLHHLHIHLDTSNTASIRNHRLLFLCPNQHAAGVSLMSVLVKAARGSLSFFRAFAEAIKKAGLMVLMILLSSCYISLSKSLLYRGATVYMSMNKSFELF